MWAGVADADALNSLLRQRVLPLLLYLPDDPRFPSTNFPFAIYRSCRRAGVFAPLLPYKLSYRMGQSNHLPTS